MSGVLITDTENGIEEIRISGATARYKHYNKNLGPDGIQFRVKANSNLIIIRSPPKLLQKYIFC